MPPQLSKQSIISRELLELVARERLAEAHELMRAGHFAGAVYLAGYGVECLLKATICNTLGWKELRGTFKTHDLENLLLHSGLDSAMRSAPDVWESFAKIMEIWAVEPAGDRDRQKSVRYRDPREFDASAASRFLKFVTDPGVGVVPWLQNKLK